MSGPRLTCAACDDPTTGEFGLLVAGRARVICGSCADDASPAALGREPVLRRILDREDRFDGYEDPCPVTKQAHCYSGEGQAYRCSSCEMAPVPWLWARADRFGAP